MNQDTLQRIARNTVQLESRSDPGAINPSSDGAGVSLGLLQWSQKGGGLHELLTRWYRDAPDALGAALGPRWFDVLDVARRAALDPVDGAPLWQEPWLSRWRVALADPRLVALQRQLVIDGSHMRAAVRAAQAMGLTTHRGWSIVFDRTVQQGAGRVQRAAKTVGRTGTEGERLQRFIDILAPQAGRWANDVRRRTAAILATPSPGVDPVVVG